MKTWKESLIEKSGEFKYSCVLAPFPHLIAEQIKKWGSEFIDSNDLYEPEGGLENEIHVTVLYGIHSTRPNKIISLFKNEKSISLKLGKTSIFDTNPAYDVVKLSVESNDLKRLNNIIKKECKYTSNFPIYVPHCTIAYVKKNTGEKYTGNDQFNGKKITIKEVVFSSSNGTKTKIKIQ